MARPNEEDAVRRRLDAIEADPELRQSPLYDDVRWLAERYFRLSRQLRKVTRVGDQLQVQLRDMNEALEKASMTDALTGLPNRRRMMECLVSEAHHADRDVYPLTLMMVDVDRFKAINDSHGHDVGDEVLRAVGGALAASLREYDVCARWGGEEFLMLLPGLGRDKARDVAERARRHVADTVVDTDAGRLSVTVSIGVAVCTGRDPDPSINAADMAAYSAKRGGRDRVVCAADLEEA